MKYKIIAGKNKGDIIELEEVNEATQTFPAKTIVWGECPDREMTWNEAVKWCKERGGRLPTSCELHQAFLDGIKGFQAASYWSGTEVPSDGTQAYSVGLYAGLMDYYTKTCGLYVRCVKDSI